MNDRRSRSSSCGSRFTASRSIPPVSKRNGTASTRNPSTPSSSQNPTILAISSRTPGWRCSGRAGASRSGAGSTARPSRRRPRCSPRRREHDLVLRLGRRLVGPDVAVTERRVAGRCGPTRNHGCSIRRVVDDEVDDDPQAAVLRRADELDEVAERAEPRVDGVEVGDVVAVVPVGRRVERHQPEAARRRCRRGSRAARSARRGRRCRRRPSRGTSRRRGSRSTAFFHQRSLVRGASRQHLRSTGALGEHVDEGALAPARRGAGRRRRSRARPAP